MKFKYKDKVLIREGFYRTHVGTCIKWHRSYTYKASVLFGPTIVMPPFYEIQLDDNTVIELREEYLELS